MEKVFVVEKRECLKPNCYNCKHRGTLPGNSQSKCCHPDVEGDLLGQLKHILGITSDSVINPGARDKLCVKGDSRGIQSGFFNWPFNFDPIWLEACNGYNPIEKPWWEDAG